jgi:hypothetical protein
MECAGLDERPPYVSVLGRDCGGTPLEYGLLLLLGGGAPYETGSSL